MIAARRSFIALMLITVLIRSAVSWFGYSDLLADPDSYARLAAAWAKTSIYGFEGEGRATPTAFRPPLYPWLLSWFVFGGQVSRSAVAVLHVVLGCGTVGLTYLIGRRLDLRFAWLAGLAVAIDPILVRQSQLVMTETLATFLAMIAWYLWLVAWTDRSQSTCDSMDRSGGQWLAAMGFSVVLGISVLARPTAAPWALLCALATLVLGCSCWKRRVNDFVLICLGVLVCVVPWTLRNWSALGKPIWATTHGGYTLLLANNPPLYRHFAANGPSRAWEAAEFQDAWAVRLSLEDRSFNEVADDQLAYQAARSTLAHDPQMFLLSSLYRVGWLWALWPYDGSFGLSEVMIAMWYAGLFFMALVGMASILRTHNYRGWLVGLFLVISLTGIHAVYWSNMRMRAPAMPCIILLAAAAKKRASNF